jgi:ABC-type sugar transport system substrate-binding protein
MRSKASSTKLRVALAFMVAGVAAVAIGCGGDDDADDGGEEAPGVADASVVLVSCTSANPWCNVYNNTIKDGLEEEGADVTVLEDEFDPSVMVRHIEQGIAQSPDVLLVHSSDDSAITPSMRRASEAGVPVFNLNGRAPEEAEQFVTAQVVADHPKLGEIAAQNCIDGMAEQGTDANGNVIMITGAQTTGQSLDRIPSFRETIEDAGHNVIEEQDGFWDQVETTKIAQRLFAKHGAGGIDCAYGMADYQAVGIVQAATQADVPVGGNDGLVVTGSNCFKVGLDAIERGNMYGTATQAPDAEGEAAVEVVTDFLNGEEVPDITVNEEFRVTEENVDEYREECDI